MSQQQPVEQSPKHKETNDQRALPVLPVRDTVLFPHAVLPLTVGRESSVQLINSLGEDKTIIVVAQREARVDSPQPSDLYTVGTSAVVHKVVKMPNRACLYLPRVWRGCVWASSRSWRRSCGRTIPLCLRASLRPRRLRSRLCSAMC